jgi:hypothetical protein
MAALSKHPPPMSRWQTGAAISTLSDTGKTGTWLVDPTDFTICRQRQPDQQRHRRRHAVGQQLATTSVIAGTDASTGSDSGRHQRQRRRHVERQQHADAERLQQHQHQRRHHRHRRQCGPGAEPRQLGSVTSGTDYKVGAPITLQRCQRHAGHQRHELYADPQHGRAGCDRQHGAERQVRAGRGSGCQRHYLQQRAGRRHNLTLSTAPLPGWGTPSAT